MASKYRPGGPKNRNKQGQRSQPLYAWKRIAEAEYADALLHGGISPKRPPATTRPLRRPRADTQTRKARAAKGNATKEANKTNAQREAARKKKSDAAKLGAERMGAEARHQRAVAGWETRDMRHGRTRKKRENERYAEDQRRLENQREYGRSRRSSNPFSHLPRGDGLPW